MVSPPSPSECPEKSRLAGLAAEAHRRELSVHNREVAEILKRNFGSDALEREMVEWRELAASLMQRLEEHVARHEC